MGPGLVFATRLLRDGAATRVGLVPCAVGGTEMDRWVPDADLYEHMVRPCADCCVHVIGQAGMCAATAAAYVCSIGFMHWSDAPHLAF